MMLCLSDRSGEHGVGLKMMRVAEAYVRTSRLVCANTFRQQHTLTTQNVTSLERFEYKDASQVTPCYFIVSDEFGHM
jgi:hypothetical protein